jgi:hypothetical protein
MMKPLLVIFIVPPDNEPVSKPAVATLSDHTYTPELIVIVALNAPLPGYPAESIALRRL